MECKIKGCLKKEYWTTGLCKTHQGRLVKHGDVYTDIPIKAGGGIALATQRKILQAKSGFQYCRFCENYKRIEKFRTKNENICKLCIRNWKLKKKYGIGNKDYNKLLKKQKGKCALCRTINPGGRYNIFNIDHNHQTGKIRGLLCNGCNTGIGQLESKKVSIAHLTKYLRR